MKIIGEEEPILTCTICKKMNTAITDTESGEVICTSCGMVIREKTEDDIHQELRRSFTMGSKDNRVRNGTPSSLAIHDMGLSSIIGRANRDARGQLLDSAMRSTVQRLRKWDSRIQVHNSEDRSFRHAFYQLDTLKDKLGLSDAIVEKTAYIYRKVQGRGLIRGRTVNGMLTAAVYLVCREMGTPRTLKDIAAISNVRRKDISRNYRLIVFELDIRIPTVDPVKCIAKVANKLNLNEKTKHKAMNIMTQMVKREITAGKEPMSLAASVIYMSSTKTGERIPQKALAAASGITEVTIRNRLRDLRSKLEIE